MRPSGCARTRTDRDTSTGRRRRPAHLLLLALISGLLILPTTPSTVGAVELDEYSPALGGSYVAVSPTRLLDTRRAGEGPCIAGERIVEVPPDLVGAPGVVLNVTATGSSSPGYVSVYAAGAARPVTAALNFARGETVENAVTSATGSGGLAVYASGGCPHVIVDLVGRYTPGRTARGGAFAPTEPSRLLDTRREGEGPCVAGERIVRVPEVPAHAGGVVLNVTVTRASAPGFVTVYAAGASRPVTSTLNYSAGRTVGNAVTSAIARDGVTVFASGGCPHVIVDIAGYFTGEPPILEGSFVAGAPARLVDTRRPGEGPCISGSRLVEAPQVPAGAAGAVLNVTVTGASAPGYVTVHGDGAVRPATSTLNFSRGQTVANAATTAVSSGGLRVYASGGCPHVIVDLVGFYSGTPAPLADVVELAAGETHTCALLGDGTVRCWGFEQGSSRTSGGHVLGDGRLESSAFPVPVAGVTDAVTIDAGPVATTCAVLADSTVTCWGRDLSNPYGPNGRLATPVPGLSGAVDVSVGYDHACALTDAGAVSCWGDGSAAAGPDEPPVPVELAGVVDVAAGLRRTCALRAAGTVTCWDSQQHEAEHLVEVPGIDDAVGITVADGYACAIRSDQSVWCWGGITDGVPDGWDVIELGEPPARIDGVSATLGDAGPVAACTASSAGGVQCFGRDWQPGVVPPLPPGVAMGGPITVPGLDGVVDDLAVGVVHACAHLESGSVVCWGWNDYGTLGNGDLEPSVEPVTVIAGTDLTGAPVPPQSTLPSTSFRYVTDPGYPVGQGGTATLTPETHSFDLVPSRTGVRFHLSGSPSASIHLAAPNGWALAVGPHDRAQGQGGSSTRPTLDVTVGGSACTTNEGRFDVRDIAWDGSGTLTRFAADFTQYCGGTTAIRGSIRWNAKDPYRPFPDTDWDGTFDTADNCPTVANGDQADVDLDGAGDGCDAEVNHTWLELHREPGATTAGMRETWHPVDGVFRAERMYDGDSSTMAIDFEAGSRLNWHVRFKSPSLDLAPGTYTDTTSSLAESREQGRPMLDVSGNGSGCSSGTGSFTIHEVVQAADGTIERFSADFEHHCGGLPPALNGRIRFNSTTP